MSLKSIERLWHKRMLQTEGAATENTWQKECTVSIVSERTANGKAVRWVKPVHTERVASRRLARSERGFRYQTSAECLSDAYVTV